MTSLTLRLVFHLALRQTEGFVASLIRLMGLGLDAPDHTTLSRRNSNVEVPRLAKTHDGPIHLVVDSTGLKIIGDGEWHAHKHKTSSKRRTWRKLHLGLDDVEFHPSDQGPGTDPSPERPQRSSHNRPTPKVHLDPAQGD